MIKRSARVAIDSGHGARRDRGYVPLYVTLHIVDKGEDIPRFLTCQNANPTGYIPRLEWDTTSRQSGKVIVKTYQIQHNLRDIFI